jgi:hypothetical protein
MSEFPRQDTNNSIVYSLPKVTKVELDHESIIYP